MKFVASVAVVALVLACESSHGQEIPRNENLKFFDAYVGTWVKEGALPEDMPFGKKGDVGTSSLTWRWTYDENAVEWKWEFDYAGKRSGTKGLLAWDASQKSVVGNGVAFDGGVIRGTVRSIDPMCTYVEFVQPDGSIHSHVETFILKGDDTMVITVTDRKGDPTAEDSPEYVFKRVRPSRPSTEAIPAKVLKELGFMIGEWETKMAVNGKNIGTATHQRRWAPGRSGLIMTWQAKEEGKPVYTFGISGWNAEDKEVLEHWYDSLGRYGTVHYPLSKMIKDAWEGTVHRVYADGTISQGTCRLQKGADCWIFTIIGEENGKPLTVKNDTRKVN